MKTTRYEARDNNPWDADEQNRKFPDAPVGYLVYDTQRRKTIAVATDRTEVCMLVDVLNAQGAERRVERRDQRGARPRIVHARTIAGEGHTLCGHGVKGANNGSGNLTSHRELVTCGSCLTNMKADWKTRRVKRFVDETASERADHGAEAAS